MVQGYFSKYGHAAAAWVGDKGGVCLAVRPPDSSRQEEIRDIVFYAPAGSVCPKRGLE